MSYTNGDPPLRGCACRAWYTDDADGRAAHKQVHGHTPRPVDRPAEQTAPTREEEA